MEDHDGRKSHRCPGSGQAISKGQGCGRVSFSFDKGEMFGLIGPNGAGKTTTIRILLTLIQPTSGETLIHNLNTVKNSEDVRECAAMYAGLSADGDLTADENVFISSKLYGMPRKKER